MPIEEPKHEIFESPYRISWIRVGKFVIPLALITLAAAYWFTFIYIPSKIEPPKETSVLPDTEATASAKPATQSAKKDEVENWKIYENKKMGFSLKYPNDWSVDDKTIEYSVDFFAKEGVDELAPAHLSITKATSGEVYNEVATSYNEISKRKVNETYQIAPKEPDGGPNPLRTRLTNQTVNGRQGIVELIKSSKDTEIGTSVNIYIKVGEIYYWIGFEEVPGKFQASKKIFDKILSTFRFD